jgi:catechol 2,3-dioxygenase-like lactoylglutathione lyase family enzyme
MPVRTLGLAHLSLAVRDPERSLAFYADAFGVREHYRDDEQIQVLGPGPHDVIAFERNPANAGKAGGIGHFGFRLAAPGDIDAVVDAALAAGGTLRRRGDFGPGLPYAYVADPDGYEIELWFEPDAESATAIATPTSEVPADTTATTPSPGGWRARAAEVFAHRCLRKVANYAKTPDDEFQFDVGLGNSVGAYRNPGSNGVVVEIRAEGLRWQGGAGWLNVPYADIVDIETPGGETTETLTLVLADGLRASLPVRGREGRFCDSTAMLYFLRRVRGDRHDADAPDDGG